MVLSRNKLYKMNTQYNRCHDVYRKLIGVKQWFFSFFTARLPIQNCFLPLIFAPANAGIPAGQTQNL